MGILEASGMDGASGTDEASGSGTDAASGGGDGAGSGSGNGGVSHRDAFLITYGNMLSAPEGNGPDESGGAPDESGLSRLFRFLHKRNGGAFSYLHILPFHPYSSDDGFSVIDYRRVDQRFGSWEDIERFKTLSLAEAGREAGAGRDRLRLAFDFVINHGSVQGEWFKGFLGGEEPYRSWYITRPAGYDGRSVVRPRTHPLLTPFLRKDKNGGEETVHVWTTFSADQADYDFSNPEVLLEFTAILLEYAARGAGIVRLDAIAYLWKEDGTPCLHHPKTHAVVKLFRAVIDYLDLPLLLLTETNVPHNENISYFGAALGDPALDTLPEAHMVYNFALPPLVLYAALTGDAGPLRRWAGTLTSGASGAESGGSFLNFLASHDGVGLTPARGLVDEGAFAEAIEEAKRRGALVSYKSTPEGDVPYELNCSYASVTAPESMGPPEIRARAFLAVHGILLSLPGLPAVYFHSWIGSGAWAEGPEALGYNRAINRERPPVDRVERELDDPGHFRYFVHRGLNRLLAFRREEAAFDPGSPRYVPEESAGGESGQNRDGGNGRSLFVILRGSPEASRRILCLHNLSGVPASWKPPARSAPWKGVPECRSLEPWETRWIVFNETGELRRISTV
ncbi:MAG: sugar phosphorylase [Treponema sp.]|jgi:sucrose phosphorylase|nr:sugar phosphorylase [Treponema sp.]